MLKNIFTLTVWNDNRTPAFQNLAYRVGRGTSDYGDVPDMDEHEARAEFERIRKAKTLYFEIYPYTIRSLFLLQRRLQGKPLDEVSLDFTNNNHAVGALEFRKVTITRFETFPLHLAIDEEFARGTHYYRVWLEAEQVEWYAGRRYSQHVKDIAVWRGEWD